MQSDSPALSQIAPHLKVVELKFGDVLAEPGGPIRRVYFPFSGAISLVVELEVGTMIETAAGRPRRRLERSFGAGREGVSRIRVLCRWRVVQV